MTHRLDGQPSQEVSFLAQTDSKTGDASSLSNTTASRASRLWEQITEKKFGFQLINEAYVNGDVEALRRMALAGLALSHAASGYLYGYGQYENVLPTAIAEFEALTYSTEDEEALHEIRSKER